jgi:hypothetical protein
VLIEKLMNFKQRHTNGAEFNAALRDLTEVSQAILDWELMASSDDGSLITDTCFVYRCRIIKSEVGSLLRRIPNRKEFKPEDREVCKMLGYQIGRLRVYSSAGEKDFARQNGPDFRVDTGAADTSIADFTSAIYDREFRKGPLSAQLRDTWERMHFKYPGCMCVQCREFKVRSSVQARSISRTVQSGFAALSAAAATILRI